MLCVKTDLKDTAWLVYILEEFKRINKAGFDITVVSLESAEAIPESKVFYYTKKLAGRPSIVNKSDILPDKNIIGISEDIYVVKGTTADDDNRCCKYDLFWNAFVFLSRLEEFLNEESGKKIKSYSKNHPRLNKDTFDTPVVNNLFDEFERIIKTNFPELSFGNKEKAIIELSHDLDYVRETPQLKIKRTAVAVFNIFKQIYLPGIVFKNIVLIVKSLFSNSSYWCFDFWENLERKFNKRSIFYVYAGFRKKELKSWFLDPSYDIRTNNRLADKLRYLINEGFEIGLHGSFDSAVNERLLTQEKEILEKALGYEITKTRQHWLRYEEKSTPYIHNKLFKFDSTLGWNDRIGFRAGCLSRYRPYGHKNKKPFQFFETPLIIMDSNIFDYAPSKKDDVVRRCFQILKSLDNYKASHVAISWHPRSCAADYRWDKVYEKILEAIG